MSRQKSPDKLIPRTVRNRPDVDAVLVRMAKKHSKGLAEVLREACEEKARNETLVTLTVDPERSVTVRMVPGRDENGRSILVAVQEDAKMEGEG